ncbi:Rieske (2Fe-2S) protein [Sulfidibacter corallicola]|uniref:Rieske (2Fe-2S) protein n=1 Tax=Sulfidibacter corallicola TaxID=2818388 RepID=A0A8A4TNC9_SULCO|nr:Rieske (2Fe-2S) protein [Sulfidibacter corallicola]QTD50438.1 Rieske (2Fe-2S) protein [Sulfidibacter corallicola]
MDWIRAIEHDRLSAGKPKVIRHGPLQIAVLRLGERVFAFANRCPHEGYPLADGHADENCVLTCHWHNWKFNLHDGNNLYDGDNLRTFPTKTESDWIWIDVAPRPKDEVQAELLGNLEGAFRDRDFGRMTRLLARFHFEELGLDEPIRAAIGWSWDRFEYGMTHALGAIPSWLELADQAGEDTDRKIAYVSEIIDHLADDSLRQPAFTYTEERVPWNETDFCRAVGREDENAAVATLNEALDRGLGWSALMPVFARAALSHYMGFGHALIYTHAVGGIVERLGESVLPHVARPLARYLCFAVREDRVPDFRRYAHYLELVPPSVAKASPDALVMPFALRTNPAMSWTVESLAEHPPEAVFRALVHQAANNMLAFDTQLHFSWRVPVRQNVSWLDFTHSLTFAEALVAHARRQPELWPAGLLQLACFVGRNQAFLADTETPPAVDSVDAEQAWQACSTELADHGLGLPILSCHLGKTAVACRRMAPLLGEDTQRRLFAALRRFFEAPIKQKHVRRTVHQALDLVGRDYRD